MENQNQTQPLQIVIIKINSYTYRVTVHSVEGVIEGYDFNHTQLIQFITKRATDLGPIEWKNQS